MELLNANNFDEKTSNGLVLIDFFANWCGPCKMLSPIIEELSEELNDKVNIYKIDVDQEPSLAQKFGVMSIPTLVLLKDGQEVEKVIGFQPKEQLVELINKY